MIELIKFCKGNSAFYTGLAVILPWLVAMKAGLITNSIAKEKMLTYFFKGMDLAVFDAQCKHFSEIKLPELIRPDAWDTIVKHKSLGHEIVVVSASAENWICDWCIRTGVKYIGTKLLTDNDNRLSGKFSGQNCNGQEKVNRIRLSYDPADYKRIYAYGDTSGDHLMLKLATDQFYRHFKK